LIALFLPLLALVFVCTGISLLVSGLYVFFRDLPYFYELITFVLWISSPIFYPEDLPPTTVKTFLVFNPLIPIIGSIRQICLSGNLPDLNLIIHSLIGGLIMLTLGLVCFRWWQPQFMDLL
jgi:ABC-type polysaccharide/polyol phosphate export permease